MATYEEYKAKQKLEEAAIFASMFGTPELSRSDSINLNDTGGTSRLKTKSNYLSYHDSVKVDTSDHEDHTFW